MPLCESPHRSIGHIPLPDVCPHLRHTVESGPVLVEVVEHPDVQGDAPGVLAVVAKRALLDLFKPRRVAVSCHGEITDNRGNGRLLRCVCSSAETSGWFYSSRWRWRQHLKASLTPHPRSVGFELSHHIWMRVRGLDVHRHLPRMCKDENDSVSRPIGAPTGQR